MSEVMSTSRPDLFSKRTESEVLAAYKKIFQLSDNISISQVMQHARLEAALTDSILHSDPSERRRIVHSAYTKLYSELDWLSGTGKERRRLEEWLHLLKPGSRVIEIGSGAGQLIAFLAEHGLSCFATELSDKRRTDSAEISSLVTWRNTDGVNLTDYEDSGSFDHVISDQVIEHLHPQDIRKHLESARDLLVDGGSYVIRTPHRSSGPHDLARVFGFDAPVYMHLHEYTFSEIAQLASDAGYSAAEAILAVPLPGQKHRWVIAANALLKYNIFWDKFESSLLTRPKHKRLFRRVSKLMLVPSSIWVRLTK